MRKHFIWCSILLTSAATSLSATCPKGSFACGTACIPDNSCNNRPNPSQPCSNTNVGPVTAWAKNATVNVYIDSSKFPTTAEQDAIKQSFQGWQTSEAGGSNVKFDFTLVNGTPSHPSGTYDTVTKGTTPSGFDGNTTWSYNASNGTLTHAQTVISSSFKSDPQSLEKLMTHEDAHTFGEGECTEAACKGTSASYQDGNTLSAPSTCDKNAVSALTNVSEGGHGTGGGGGSGNGKGDPGTCSGSAPNDTCDCVGTTWFCDCAGSPGNCSGGGQEVCVNGSWTCGTVSVCIGTPPTCSNGSAADCVNDAWQCQSDSCI
jgi:hypothetical protein